MDAPHTEATGWNAHEHEEICAQTTSYLESEC